MIGNRYSLSSSTVYKTGKLHLAFNIGYQDSFKVRKSNGKMVAIISDGCTNSANGYSKNQMGAILGADFLCDCAYSHLNTLNPNTWSGFNDVINCLSLELCFFFGGLISTYARFTHVTQQKILKDFVNSKLLFTVVGFMVYYDWYCFFGYGDGIYGEGINYNVLLREQGFSNYILSDVFGEMLCNNQTLLRQRLPMSNTSFGNGNCKSKEHILLEALNNRCSDSQAVKYLKIYEQGKISRNTLYWIASDGITPFLTDTRMNHDFETFLYHQDVLRYKNRKDLTFRPFNAFVNKYKSLDRDDITMVLCKRPN